MNNLDNDCAICGSSGNFWIKKPISFVLCPLGKVGSTEQAALNGSPMDFILMHVSKFFLDCSSNHGLVSLKPAYDWMNKF